MANIIDTLHPKTSPTDNLYPNIKKANIPDNSIDFSKLDSAVTSAITSATPQVFDTEANILALTADGGVAVATDTGYIYIWDSDNSIYSSTGLLYQATGIADSSVTPAKTTFVESHTNLYDPTKLLANYLWDSSLTLTAYSSYYAYSEAITLEANKTYYFLNFPHISVNFSYIVENGTTTILKNSAYWDSSALTITTSSNSVSLYLTTNKTSNLLNPSNPFYVDNACLSTYSENYIITGTTFNELANNINLEHHIFYVGSRRAITTLKEGIETATLYRNSIVYVDGETFDLVSEYDEDVLDAYTEDDYEIGLIIKNGVKVIFSPGSKVTFNYTGTNYYVNTLFSPFNFSYVGGGGSIIGLNLECSNCRYCVHDDQSSSLYTEYYHNEIIRCTFSIDNSANSNWSYQEIDIGGGLGYNGLIEIKECIFGEYSYYHQNAGNLSGSRSDIYYSNNYSENTFKLTSNSSWTNITDVSRLYAYGNSTTEEIAIVDSGGLGNVALYSINNVVR